MKSPKNPFEFRAEFEWSDVPKLADDAVSRVLVVGDMHGNVSALAHARRLAARKRVDAVVQVGDFWLSDRHWHRHDASEAHYMHYAAEQFKMPLIVVDGNHEAWPALERYAGTQAAQAAFASRRPVHLGGSLWWAWRGSVWQWQGRRIGALGGAVSPDREVPSLSNFRWSAEGTTEEDLWRLVDNADAEFEGALDVLFTHDSPAQVTGLKSEQHSIPDQVWREMNWSRRVLAEAVDRLSPRILFHGHWHTQNRETINDTTDVICLERETAICSAARLDLGGADGDITADYTF